MEFSLTRKLSQTFLDKLLKAEPESEVEVLDLVNDPPPLMKPEWISGAFNKGTLTKTEEHALKRSDEYIDQIWRSDLIVIGAPMYNYGMPAALKAWIDQVARINKTFSFDLSRGDYPIEPILKDKQLVMFTSSGEFDFERGGAREQHNHLVPHLKSCMHYLGVSSDQDFYHAGIEFQEFKDYRHEQSKEEAFNRLSHIVKHVRFKEGSSHNFV